MKLQEFYNSVRSLTPGTEITHNGYTLRKIDTNKDSEIISSPDHSEVEICNKDGQVIEIFTLGAFDSFQEFVYELNKVLSNDSSTLGA